MEKNIRAMAHAIRQEVIDFRRDLHQHPEASMKEFRTTDKVAAGLDALGIPYRRLEPTGIIAELEGKKGPGKRVALRADMDALSIQEKTDYPFKSVNDGFMHACGHDTHTAMLLGAAKLLKGLENEFSGSVRFFFQPGEEVCEGAKAVVAQGGMQGVDAAFGLHIGAMREPGTLWSRPGASHAATDWYKVKLTGKVCHGAAPQMGMDATVCAAALVMNLQTMVSREFSPMEPLVVTVGSLHSGSRFNIISGEALLEGTIRCYSRELHAAIPAVLERICKKTAETFRCTAEVEYNAITDVVINDAEMVELGMAAARKVADSPDKVGYQEPTAGGEDFSEYTAFAPCAFFSLGAGGNFPGHSDRLELDEETFEIGTAFYVQTALDALEKLNSK